MKITNKEEKALMKIVDESFKMIDDHYKKMVDNNDIVGILLGMSATMRGAGMLPSKTVGWGHSDPIKELENDMRMLEDPKWQEILKKQPSLATKARDFYSSDM